MRTRDRAEYWFLVLCLLLVIAALAPGDAWASGDCRDGSCNEVILSGGDNTANNSASVGGSDTMALSHSLGDVDINDCLASTQWGTIIVSRQRVVLNKWCAAEVYDYKGLHHMAALLRCDIPEISEHFQTKPECVTANTVQVEVPRGEPEVLREESDVSDSLNAVLSRLNELEARNSELQAEYDALRERQDSADARRQRSIVAAREQAERERQTAQEALTALEAYQ